MIWLASILMVGRCYWIVTGGAATPYATRTWLRMMESNTTHMDMCQTRKF